MGPLRLLPPCFRIAGRGGSGRPRRRLPALVLLLAVVLPVWIAGSPAEAGRSQRFGIEGRLVDYDPERQVFRVFVLSREAGGFGGSTVGGRAPDDVEEREEMEFAVQPEGSVLSRTVIKSMRGTGLDNSGTQEGFSRAVEAIPTDRPLALSIERNRGAGEGEPAYKLKTVIIRLTEAEMRQRMEELLED